MIFLRSILFNILFYISLAMLMLVCLPLLLFNRRIVSIVGHVWAQMFLWLLRVVCGLKVEFRGLENIPKGGVILAPKHQSVWETFALIHHAPEFCFILKRELMWIPLFGWYLSRSGQIAIDRAKASTALAQAVRKSREAVEDGRQLIIFPEGTRRPAGAEPQYKFGVAAIYHDSGVPCVPVALNSGLFWARRSFLRRPGTVVVEYLPAIEPGLDKRVFMKRLMDEIETATHRITQEAVALDPSLAQMLKVQGSDSSGLN
jgi:1-acyl-sn-glycerol-3-phosphate acyltransferase